MRRRSTRHEFNGRRWLAAFAPEAVTSITCSSELSETNRVPILGVRVQSHMAAIRTVEAKIHDLEVLVMIPLVHHTDDEGMANARGTNSLGLAVVHDPLHPFCAARDVEVGSLRGALETLPASLYDDFVRIDRRQGRQAVTRRRKMNRREDDVIVPSVHDAGSARDVAQSVQLRAPEIRAT